MLKRLISLTVAALLLLTGSIPAAAEFKMPEQEIPAEPIVTDGEYFRIICAYDAEANLSRYTITIKEAARFADGTPVTADDILFTWYLSLDSTYPGKSPLMALDIPGLHSHRLALTEQEIADGLAIMDAIAAAGRDYAPSETDAWTSEIQQLYWQLSDDRAAAAEAEFPVLAQQIVDFCTSNLTSGAFGFSAEEILSDDGLKTALAMQKWAHAVYDGARLTAPRTGQSWMLAEGDRPSAEDFANVLKQTYSGDFAACYAVECPDPAAYTPELPEIEDPFLLELYASNQTAGAETISIRENPPVSGLRKADNRTLEADIRGIDMRSERVLLGMRIFSLAECGSAESWNPGLGDFGFEPWTAPEALARNTMSVQLMETANPDVFSAVLP